MVPLDSKVNIHHRVGPDVRQLRSMSESKESVYVPKPGL